MGVASAGDRAVLLRALGAWAVTRLLLVGLLARDVDAGDGVMALTHEWAGDLAQGDSPYHEVGVGYPPLAMWVFLVPVLGVDASGYQVTFAALILVADLVGVVVAWRAERHGSPGAALGYTLALPAAGGVLLLWRYDLLPALAHLTAAFLLLRGNRWGSWAALGVGIALKPYLAVAVPLWLVWERRVRDAPLGALAGGAGVAAAPSAAALLTMAPVAGWGALLPYTFQFDRGVTLDSTPGLLLDAIGDPEAVFAQGCLCWERAGSGSDVAGLVGTAAVVLGVVGVTWWAWRRGTRDAVLAGSAAAVLVVVLAAPVFSPQYVIWPLPVLAVARRRGALVTAAVGAAFAGLSYPALAGDLITGSALGDVLAWGRVAALAGALALVLLERPDARNAQAVAAPRSCWGADAGPRNRSATR